jgi:hypothetical protein
MTSYYTAEGGSGYSIVVRVGGSYRLDGLTFSSDVTIEFSDPIFGRGPRGVFPTEAEEVTLYMRT